MAFKIVEGCINCWACESLCPSRAIYEARPHFLIDTKNCTECEGDYSDPQCASICPGFLVICVAITISDTTYCVFRVTPALYTENVTRDPKEPKIIDQGTAGCFWQARHVRIGHDSRIP